jgi:hypothetical protein
MKSRLHLTQKPPHQGNKRREEEVLFVKAKKSLAVIFKRQGNLNLALTVLTVAILIFLGSVDKGVANSSGAMPRASFAIAQKNRSAKFHNPQRLEASLSKVTEFAARE